MAEDRYDCVMQYCAVQLFVFPLCLSFVQGQVSGWCWCVLQHRRREILIFFRRRSIKRTWVFWLNSICRSFEAHDITQRTRRKNRRCGAARAAPC